MVYNKSIINLKKENMNNLPNCIPQSIYQPDISSGDFLTNLTCPLCGEKEVYEENVLDEEGFRDTSYWCDNCEKYICQEN